MDGEAIRQARLERGWTQAELAAQVGRSQATISALENGKTQPSPLLRRRLEAVLLSPGPPAASALPGPRVRFRLPDLEIPEKALGLPLAVTRWRRPETSGDFLLLVPLPGDALFVAAVDVTGHGISVVPASLYIQGWLRGWLASLKSPPRLRSLIQELSSELKRAAVDCAGYFALFASQPSWRHAVSLEAFCLGFPPPILLAGPPFRTLDPPSLGPPLPVDERALPLPQTLTLPAPWRLVLASDGLLSRLGGGEERLGLRRLREWQHGPNREEPPDRHLQTAQPSADDELFALLSWDGWDLEAAFSTLDDSERHRTLEIVHQSVANRLGAERADAMEQALIEALANARRHAYPGGEGVVLVRFREEQTGVRAEVEDQGVDRIGERRRSSQVGGFEVMRAMVGVVEVRARGGGGTIVTLALASEATPPGSSEEGGSLGLRTG